MEVNLSVSDVLANEIPFESKFSCKEGLHVSFSSHSIFTGKRGKNEIRDGTLVCNYNVQMIDNF